MTARQTLQASPKIKDVAAIVQSGLFDHCCDVALLELLQHMPNSTVPSNSTAAGVGLEARDYYQQLQGAKRILAILKDLATIPSEPKANKIGQLNPQ